MLTNESRLFGQNDGLGTLMAIPCSSCTSTLNGGGKSLSHNKLHNGAWWHESAVMRFFVSLTEI